PLPGFHVVGLAELERYPVAALGHRHTVAVEVVSHGLVERVLVAADKIGIAVGHDLAADDARFEFVSLGPAVLTPSGLGECGHVGTEDPRAPMNAHESVASVAKGIAGVAAHASGPELQGGHGGVVFEPGDGPLVA